MRHFTLALAFVFYILSNRAIADPIEEKWGAPLKGPFGLKEYVVSILLVKSQPDFEDQKLKVSKPTAAFLSAIDVMPLLYAFDSFQSERDIKDLAQLSSYYVGEAAGELYRCLVLRKGEKIRSVLETLAAKKSNECIDRFGSHSKICVPDKEYKASLKSYVDTIVALTKAHSTTPGCTTTGWSEM
jgi:hypothetical protein